MTTIATQEGRFRPRARLLTTLGAELISSEIVAVIELVRNCYDADASNVSVRFDSITDRKLARLTITDDGHGMSGEILLGPWLEPATDFKAGKARGFGGSVSPGGRRRLGSKGVGRFASQRLGRHLELATALDGEDLQLQAAFDWGEFEDGNRYLDELRVPWRRTGKEFGRGTELRITELRDDWSPERLARLKLGLSRLISPSFDRDTFVVRLIVDGEETLIRPAVEELAPMYSIRGHIDDKGHAAIEWQDLSGSRESWHRDIIWDVGGRSCGSFQFHFNAWDLDRPALESYFEVTHHPQGIRDFRRYLKERSGISLYRDGFRILPYGEPDNDWLRLDRRRVNNPTMRLSNNQVLGWIQLRADGNPGLTDQTNREGLVANDQYEHLTQATLELLQMLEARRFAARRTWLASRNVSLLPGVGNSRRQQLRDAVSTIVLNGTGEKPAKKLQRLLDEREREVMDTVRQYASLAANGQMAGMVFEQLQLPVRQLTGLCDLLLADVEVDQLGSDDIDRLRETLADMRQRLRGMQGDMKRMAPLASGRGDATQSRFALKDVVADVMPAFELEAQRRGVFLEREVRRDATVHSSPTAVSQALAAVIDNAIYWASLEKRGGNARVTVDGGRIEVTNSGPAIDAAVMEDIFKPHFSLRRDDTVTGLGLTLAKELLEGAGATITLDSLAPVRFCLSFTGAR